MAAKPRKSAVQNLIKNLLETEIPDIQTASKELADWIKQLEQHSFKLQHYATEIESWAAEEDEVDTIELTDLIKDLESTLNDMRQTGALPPPSPAQDLIEEPAATGDKLQRGYGRSGRVIRTRELPRSELRADDGRAPVKRIEQAAGEKEAEGPVRTPQGILVAKDRGKPAAKAELPTGGKEVVVRREGKEPREDTGPGGYLTPEGFVVKRTRH
ncbi:MAG: hypothetical protein JW901_11580 [Dehalococcoidia bacterium]|nr:hypothetical protein [Dehalococcoidia bacterium]